MPESLTTFEEKRHAAAANGNHYYGDGGTIHDSTDLAIEIDAMSGAVTAVWFRCKTLPFRVWVRGPEAYHSNPEIEIHGIEWSDKTSRQEGTS
jgi:hypothetical protein